MTNMSDLKMIAEGASIKARIKNTMSKRGHIGILIVRNWKNSPDKPFTIYIQDESRYHYRYLAINPIDIGGLTTNGLELKSSNGRYVPLEKWIEDEQNLRDLAVSITDSEWEGPENNWSGNINNKEDELREHFGLEPFNRPAPHIGKPAMI